MLSTDIVQGPIGLEQEGNGRPVLMAVHQNRCYRSAHTRPCHVRKKSQPKFYEATVAFTVRTWQVSSSAELISCICTRIKTRSFFRNAKELHFLGMSQHFVHTGGFGQTVFPSQTEATVRSTALERLRSALRNHDELISTDVV
jgi:hypothetical protein